MEKLELKHVVNYALNKVKIIADDAIWDIRSIDFESNILELINEYNAGGNEFTLYEVQPILYPLSYLTEKISHNGETFIPRNKFYGNPLDFEILQNSYRVVEKLIEWRFDIYGLIDKGLAVPVTDEFNPYKL